MYTGIIESLGTVRSVSSQHLVVEVQNIAEPWVLGESIQVNGVCLTLVSVDEGLHFDTSPETQSRTNLHTLRVGSKVNIERSMPAGGRFGGHIVHGTVDGQILLVKAEQNENSWVYTWEVPTGCEKYLIDKGSICIDGISLTVVRPKGVFFETHIIPHTHSVTNLQQISPGYQANVEYDAIAKYLEKLLQVAGKV